MAQSPECILSDLNLRAMESSKSANFESALHDANAMQQLSPSSALGYIRAAAIYSEQGKQLQVIDVCTKGLSLVDTNDTHYAILQQAKDDAIQRQNKRIDFVSQLPVEVVITRLIPLFMDDKRLDSSIPYPYLHVSNEWRDRILLCFGGLRFMVRWDDDHNAERCSQVIKFSRHTKALNIAWYSQGTWLSDLLRENDFSSLRRLNVDGFSNSHDTDFLSALKAISNTLTHLHIRCFLEENILPTADIVSACPNLVTLYIANTFDANLTSRPMTTYPNIKTLTIIQAKGKISSEEVVEIWTRFPSLKRLHLSPCVDGDSALLLPRYRPSIKRIVLRADGERVQLAYEDHGHSNDDHGVKAIDIAGFFSTTYSVADGIRLLQQYHGGLESLIWDMGCDTNDEALHNVQYPCLKKLILRCSGWWIPGNAPVLEELEVKDTVIRGNTDVLDTIPPQLKTLKMRLGRAVFPSYTASIERYLHRLAQETQLTLLAIYFYNVDDTNSVGRVLDAICGLSQLDRLRVGFSDSWDGKQMQRFFNRLAKGCPRLSCLEIICTNAPPTTAMNALKGLEFLDRIAFSINGTKDDFQFWTAIMTFSQLKCITIYPPQAVNKNDITLLKQQRPDMKIYSATVLMH